MSGRKFRWATCGVGLLLTLAGGGLRNIVGTDPGTTRHEAENLQVVCGVITEVGVVMLALWLLMMLVNILVSGSKD